MSFPDITAELKAGMPQLRGRLLANQALKDLTWFRVGGPAQVLFMPEDEADLAYLLERLPAAVPDVKVAQAAQEAGVGGLAFLRGIPGAIGGALRMNGGAYGRETKDVLVEARGVDRAGTIRTYSNTDMGFTYRHCGVPDDVIFTEGVFE